MSTSINLGPLIGSVLSLLLGTYALRVAWLALRHKRRIISPMDKIALEVQRALRRPEAAARLEAELLSDRYVSRTGWFTAGMGGLLILGGILVGGGVLINLLSIAAGSP